MPRAIVLDGHGPLPGFGLPLHARKVRPKTPELSVRVKTPPGSGAVRLEQVELTYQVADGAGNQRLEPVRVPISPVVVPGSREDAYGMAAEVPLRLPTGHLAAVELWGNQPAIIVEVRFLNEHGAFVRDGAGGTFLATLSFPRDGATAPAAGPASPGCGAEVPAEPVLPPASDLSGTPGAQLAGFSPPIGLIWTAAETLSQTTVEARMQAPGHRPGATLETVVLTYHAGDQASAPIESAVAVTALPDADADQPGAPRSVSLSLDEPALRTFIGDLNPRPSLVIARFRFKRGDGFLVQDENLEAASVDVPIVVE